VNYGVRRLNIKSLEIIWNRTTKDSWAKSQAYPRTHRGRRPSAEHCTPVWPMMCYQETKNVQGVCRKFGISRKTFYKWLKRYQEDNGDTRSLVDRSRRPHRFPRATPESSVQILKEAREQTGFGQRRLRAYLEKRYHITLSERTIWKILKKEEMEEGMGKDAA